MRRVEPQAIIIGAMATLVLACLAYLILPTGPEAYVAGRRAFGAVPYWPTVPLIVLIFAHLAGGMTAGRLAHSAAGLNGALSAVLLPLAVISGYVAFFVAIDLQHLNSASEIRDLLADEEAGGIIVLALALCVYLPPGCLAGYIGGKLGSRGRTAREVN